MEAVFGVEKTIEMALKDECPHCHGTGAKPGTQPQTCSRCGGKGQIVYTQQSLFGTVRNVQTCPDCHGTGKIVKEKCRDCAGTGYVKNTKKIQISIPAGVDSGQSVRVAGKGEPGVNGGPRGDLLVGITVDRHPVFQRQGYDIYTTVPISFVDAALGADITINTVDGDVKYSVKPGTQTDTRVTLKGKGVPTIRNKNVRGNHYATLVVKVPERLNNEQREALLQFDAAMRGRKTAVRSEETHSEPKKKKGFMDKMKEVFEDKDD